MYLQERVKKVRSRDFRKLILKLPLSVKIKLRDVSSSFKRELQNNEYIADCLSCAS